MAPKKKSYKRQSLFQLGLVCLIIILLNVLAGLVYKRYDLTNQNRYTLTQPTIDMLKQIRGTMIVKVYLKGDFPPGFQRLQNSIREILQEFRVYSNQNIEYQFIDPSAIEDRKRRQTLYRQLSKKGVEPTNLTVPGNNQTKNQLIFPGAVINYKGGEVGVNLLKNQQGLGPEQSINNSIAGLEYQFARGIHQLLKDEKSVIGVLQGHGELPKRQLASMTNTLSKYHDVQWIDITEVIQIPSSVQALIIPRPQKPFDERDKFKLDQYIMNGGKVIWLLDQVNASMDSLRRRKKAFLARQTPLNLRNQLFNYGVRVQPALIQDYNCLKIPILSGRPGQKRQQLHQWYYHPILFPTSDHPIVNNLDAVMTRFANPLDTVGKGNIQKTVLLKSSKYSRIVHTPHRVHLNIIQNTPPRAMFDNPYQPVAVLLEGKFESAFKDRLAPNTYDMLDSIGQSFNAQSPENKMIVVGDGDIIKNSYNRKGKPYPVGYYKYQNYTFANGNFLKNCIEYLTDESGIIKAKKNEIKLRLMDKQKISNQRRTWQVVNLAGPLLFIGLFGFIFNFIRIRRYGY